MKNIIFSTTRQWNPGDEIILKGVINLLESLQVEFNPLIFNRNPDIRSSFGILQYREKADCDDVLWYYIKPSMFDNSVKPWTDYSMIDAIVFAGTPEWQGLKCRELYINAVRYHIPVYLIGIDDAYWGEDDLVASVLRSAKFISIRNMEIKNSFVKKGFFPNYLPCPSIFASETVKKINQIRCIGLIYRGMDESVTYRNGWSQENYNIQKEFFDQIISKYKNQCRIIVICHYVDELNLAKEEFSEAEIRYSYNSEDYLKIYGVCDLVIGSRIHGIGLAASLGIPSIPIKYDERGGTIDGFYPDTQLFKNLNGIEALERCFVHIREMNQELITYKNKVFEKYHILLEKKLDFKKISYDYNLTYDEHKK